MSYSTAETGVKTVIQKINGYSVNNCTINDYRVLALGQSKGVVLKKGASNHSQKSMGATPLFQNFWGINAELYLPFIDEAPNLAGSVRDESQKIVDEIRKWPKLDGVAGMVDVRIDSVTEPEEWLIGTGRWWRQIINIMVEELETVTLSE